MTVPVGLFGNVSTYALIQRIETEAEIVVYAHEGLIKQNLSAKTIEKLKKGTLLIHCGPRETEKCEVCSPRRWDEKK